MSAVLKSADEDFSHELTRTEVLALIRGRIKQAGSQKAVAFQLGISEQYLSDILKWKPLSPKVLKALGLEVREATFRRVE